MKIFLFNLIAVLIFSIIPTCYGSDRSDDLIVFDMKYYNGSLVEKKLPFYMGFGLNPIDDYKFKQMDKTFLNEVKKECPDIKVFTIYHFQDNQYVYVDYKNKKILAMYYDVNQNGKLDKNEKLTQYFKFGVYKFITPEFEIESSDGRKVPLQMLFEAEFENGKKQPFITWYPASYFLGTTKVKGQIYNLCLMMDVFKKSYSYTKLDASHFVLIPINKKISKANSKEITSQINFNDSIYNVSFMDFSKDSKSFQVEFIKNKTSLVDFKFEFIGNNKIKTKIGYIEFLSDDGETIKITKHDKIRKLPIGRYKIKSALIHYGKKWDQNYHCFLRESDYFDIKKNNINSIIVGKPQIVMNVNRKGLNGDIEDKEAKTINIGDSLNIGLSLKGMNQEYYGTFRRRKRDYSDTNIEPMLKVIDSDGKEVFSNELFYYVYKNSRGHITSSWQPDKPGKYTLVISLDTGDLMGVIEDRCEIKVIDPKRLYIITGICAGIFVIIVTVLLMVWVKKGDEN